MSSEISSKLLELITKLQPDANKKDKKTAYQEVLLYVNSHELSEEDLQLLFIIIC